MKSKLKIINVVLILVALSIGNFYYNSTPNNNKINLNTLLKVAIADNNESGGGYYYCVCVECPNSEWGCWSYNYDDYPAPDFCGGDNEGYLFSWQCSSMPGTIEQHVTDCIPNGCDIP